MDAASAMTAPLTSAEALGPRCVTVAWHVGTGRPLKIINGRSYGFRSQITDMTVKRAWTGPAPLQLFEHALAPLADLPVREIVSASHILVDLTLGRASCVFDYLAD